MKTEQTFVRSQTYELKIVRFLEACQYYQLTESELYKKTLKGEVPCFIVNKTYYYPIAP